MRNIKQAWDELGIAPCSDVRAVKRAYAARLKQIDPDTDIAGFTRLREAFEAARQDARFRKEDEAYADQEHTLGGLDSADLGLVSDDPGAAGDATFSVSADYLSDTSVDGVSVDYGSASGEGDSLSLPMEHLDGAYGQAPPQERVSDPLDAHFEAIYNCLEKNAFLPEDSERTREAAKAILADERMEQIEFSEGIENALINIVRGFSPKSDSVLQVANAYFRWSEEVERASPRWHILEVGQQAYDLECITALEDPEHKWHEAFAALKQGAPEQFSYGDRARLQPRIVQLVASLRQHNPGVEERFHPSVINRWMELNATGMPAELTTSEGISWYWLLLLAMIVVQLGRLLGHALGLGG